MQCYIARFRIEIWGRLETARQTSWSLFWCFSSLVLASSQQYESVDWMNYWAIQIHMYKYKCKYKYKQIRQTLLKLNRKSADEMNYWAVTEVNHATRPVQCYHSCTRMSRGFGEHPKHQIPRRRPGSIGNLFFRNVRDLSKITLSSQNYFFTLW